MYVCAVSINNFQLTLSRNADKAVRWAANIRVTAYLNITLDIIVLFLSPSLFIFTCYYLSAQFWHWSVHLSKRNWFSEVKLLEFNACNEIVMRNKNRHARSTPSTIIVTVKAMIILHFGRSIYYANVLVLKIELNGCHLFENSKSKSLICWHTKQ